MTTDNQFNNDLNELRGEISFFASLVESMIKKSVASIYSKDRNTLNEVIFSLEPKANEAELEIDNRCISITAKYSPKASSLRLIQSIMKINLDLERMADHTVNICRDGIDLINQSVIIDNGQILEMTDETLQMFQLSINSFYNMDVDSAKVVCESDEKVDNLKNTIYHRLIHEMKIDQSTIEKSLLYLSISKNLERIADLSTNIAENTIYAYTGNTIKHSYK